jgi:hypothetical protein
MLKLTSVDLKKVKTETLIIPVCEDKEIHDDATISLLIKKAKQLLKKSIMKRCGHLRAER